MREFLQERRLWVLMWVSLIGTLVLAAIGKITDSSAASAASAACGIIASITLILMIVAVFNARK